MSQYWGEFLCQAQYKSGKNKGLSCTKKAYYIDEDQLRCGTHSSKETRETLPKNPNRAEQQEAELKRRVQEVEAEQAQNYREGLQGEVISQKLRMMAAPTYTYGFQLVFPNFRHQNRKDGFGCRSLSPKFLGPIPHLNNRALTLENYHQGAKVFPSELDSEGNPLPSALRLRQQLYQDPEPRRHKFGKKLPNAPAYSIYFDPEGNEHRYNYLQCRYFYCYWYEKLAPETSDFKQLKRWLNQGRNLDIVGYDGYSLDPIYDELAGTVSEENLSAEVLWICYNDTSRPFGHELVLLSLLVLSDPEQYPWNRYARENWELYQGVIEEI